MVSTHGPWIAKTTAERTVDFSPQERPAANSALLCSPSQEDSKDLFSILQSFHLRVISATDADHALKLAHNHSFALILVNLDSDLQWRSTLRTLQAQAPGAGLLVYSDRCGSRRWLDALEAGASDFVCKPFRRGEIRWIVENTLRARSDRIGPGLSCSQLHAA